MKITIYELLGMVKDGKAPKKIKYHNESLYFYDENKNYYNDEEMHSLFSCIGCKLNDEVEILEEEKEMPEKILNDEFDELTKEAKLWKLFYKYNDLLDYLKSKGDE